MFELKDQMNKMLIISRKEFSQGLPSNSHGTIQQEIQHGCREDK